MHDNNAVFMNEYNTMQSLWMNTIQYNAVLWMNEWMTMQLIIYEWMNEWMNAWMNEWMNENE